MSLSPTPFPTHVAVAYVSVLLDWCHQCVFPCIAADCIFACLHSMVYSKIL
ncbi:uncharacterized protein DS421_4g114390 [Arachis hypogaea]|nr:uncharacterized protein DS421_4g114390 [Arachis hypogaea]